MINCEVWAYGWLKTTLMLTNSLEGFVELTQSHTLTVMVSYSGRTQIKISQGTRCIEQGRGKLSRLMSIESVTPSNHLILCHPLLLLPSVFQDIFQWVSSASGGQSIGASAFSASMVLWTVLIPPSSDVWHTQSTANQGHPPEPRSAEFPPGLHGSLPSRLDPSRARYGGCSKPPP